tara:strand:- start:165 stop:512 length:348 start_codon:yes stop_codon:yes gene_type:complete
MADPTYTYTWDFDTTGSALRYNLNDPDKGLVTAVNWCVKCVSSDNYESQMNGSQGFEKGDSFTPFEDLTKSQVIGWVKTDLTDEIVTEIETKLKNKIIQQRTPTIGYGTPSSWSS